MEAPVCDVKHIDPCRMSLFDHSTAGVILQGIASDAGSIHTGVESTARRVLENKMKGQENKKNRDTTMEKGGKIQSGST